MAAAAARGSSEACAQPVAAISSPATNTSLKHRRFVLFIGILPEIHIRGALSAGRREMRRSADCRPGRDVADEEPFPGVRVRKVIFELSWGTVTGRQTYRSQTYVPIPK